MLNKIIFLLVFIFLISLVGALDCAPSYKCEDWGKCVDGFQSRVCVDSKCKMKDITERQLCGENKLCSPKIQCTPWSECVYTDKIESFLQGELKFGGYKTRTCTDSSKCVESFNEERSCGETFKLETKRVKECGNDFLLVLDSESKKRIAKINVDSWENKKLEIGFSNEDSCSSCFDGIKNSGEEGVDCGGNCGKCKIEKKDSRTLMLFFSWGLFVVFGSLGIREAVRNGKK